MAEKQRDRKRTTDGARGATKRAKPRKAAEAPERKTAGRRRPASDDARSPSLRFAPVESAQVPAFVDLLRGAYPMFMEDRQRALEGYHRVQVLGHPALIGGLDRSGAMIGGYAYFTFVATIRGRGLPASGLGMVATALDRKKERVALAIVRDYVRRTRRDRVPLSFLYPFRHDFYADMGWAPVAEARQHFLRPSSLPLYPERKEVRLVRDPDWRELDRVHRQFLGRQGGLGLSRHASRWMWLLQQTPLFFLAYENGRPEGYLIARFQRRPAEPDPLRYDLVVSEMEWTTPGAMRGLLGLLASQRDQVSEIILDWPRDRHLDAILREPVRPGRGHVHNHLGHGPIAGLGAMMRLEDPAEAFRLRPCAGRGALSLEVATIDPLAEDRPIRFRAELRGEAAAEGPEGATGTARAQLACGLGTLSRLWAGALRAREAVEFGLAEISPLPAVEALDRLLAVSPPWIVERF